MHISRRLRQISPSKTVAFTSLIQSLRREGRRIIDFAVGEPAFDPPAAAIAATHHALDEGQVRYGPVAGLPQLRAALADRFPGCGPDNVVVSNGSKQSLFLAFQAICDPGDEVIIPSPCWVSFAEQVKLAGARPIFVGTIAHQLDVGGIQKAVTPRTRAVLINSPNNPTGAVYPAEQLEELVCLVIKKGLILIADEAYHGLVYDGRPPDSVFDWETVRSRAIITRSFSKEYAMTGFRIGYAVASAAIAAAMATLQSHMCGNVCTFAQYGALAAIDSGGGIAVDQLREMEKKRDLAHTLVTRMFACVKPGGAFYLFPDVSRQMGDFASSADMAAYLLQEAGVAMVPGEAFGAERHLRISYALPEELLIEGFERMRNAL